MTLVPDHLLSPTQDPVQVEDLVADIRLGINPATYLLTTGHGSAENLAHDPESNPGFVRLKEPSSAVGVGLTGVVGQPSLVGGGFSASRS